jgi:ArsR family transcriptional regulator, zinc-responsive transcriptional repressor
MSPSVPVTSTGGAIHAPTLQPVTLCWKESLMATAIPHTKKSRKTVPTVNDPLLRTRTIQRTAMLLKQISDPTRLQVVSLLSERERHVGGLCHELVQGPPAMSHHLALLRHGGIVDRRRQGKNNFYSLTEVGYRLSKIVKDVVR